jgi:hypothetical protein
MVERQDANVLVDERLRALVSARQAAMGGAAPVRSFLATKGAFEGNTEGDYDSVGALAVEFMRLISGQPPSGVAQDVFRLTYLADFHEKEATRHNACVRQQVGLTGADTPPHRSKTFSYSACLRLSKSILHAHRPRLGLLLLRWPARLSRPSHT